MNPNPGLSGSRTERDPAEMTADETAVRYAPNPAEQTADHTDGPPPGHLPGLTLPGEAGSGPPPPSGGSYPSFSDPVMVTGTADGSGTAPMGRTGLPPSTGPFGPYDLVDELARGGMGVVYRAKHRGLDRVVALKMILGLTGGSQDKAVQRFILEAKAAAALDHPNVVPIFDCGEIDGRAYFTMALIDGPNLKGYVEDNGVRPIPETVGLFAGVVDGVAHAHAAGIIHRDLKPANVLMDRDGRPRVTDFGLAKRSEDSAELTGTGQVMGTPAYMPPEQARNSKYAGPPADVYSLGAILYFLLTGRPPFVGESVSDLLIKMVTEEPEPPSKTNPACPPELEALCLRCLAKTPEARFADARELAAALDPLFAQFGPRGGGSRAVLSGLVGVPAPRPASIPGLVETIAPATVTSVPSPAAAPPQRSKKPAAALAAVAGLLAVGAVVLAVRPKPEPAVTPNNTGGGGTASIVAKDGGTVAVPPGVDAKTAVAGGWPTPAENDFKLDVQFVSVARKGADGTTELPGGTQLQMRLLADRDCNVAVWNVDATGAVTQILPNKRPGGDNTALKAGQTRVLPDGNYFLDLEPTDGNPIERLRVFATTGPLPDFPPVRLTDNMPVYDSPAEKDKLVSSLRGIVARAKSKFGKSDDVKVAEAELTYRVK